MSVRIVPPVFTSMLCALFIIGAERETHVHLLAAIWLTIAMTVLILAICRWMPLGHTNQPQLANGGVDRRAAEWRMKCHTWGQALTVCLIIATFAFLYFLD
jgi:hypothetical protein